MLAAVQSKLTFTGLNLPQETGFDGLPVRSARLTPARSVGGLPAAATLNSVGGRPVNFRLTVKFSATLPGVSELLVDADGDHGDPPAALCYGGDLPRGSLNWTPLGGADGFPTAT